MDWLFVALLYPMAPLTFEPGDHTPPRVSSSRSWGRTLPHSRTNGVSNPHPLRGTSLPSLVLKFGSRSAWRRSGPHPCLATAPSVSAISGTQFRSLPLDTRLPPAPPTAIAAIFSLARPTLGFLDTRSQSQNSERSLGGGTSRLNNQSVFTAPPLLPPIRRPHSDMGVAPLLYQ